MVLRPRRAGGWPQDVFAPAKPPNYCWSPPGPGKGLAAWQGAASHLVLPEQAGTTRTAALVHNLNKPSRMIKILQYATLKSKAS